MKEPKNNSIELHLHTKLDGIKELLNHLNMQCSSLQNPTIVNEINQALESFNTIKPDDERYKILTLIFELTGKIKIFDKENKELEQLIQEIDNGLKTIRKEIYFAQYLSAELEVAGIRSSSDARLLAERVNSLGKLCDNLEDRIKKQHEALLTYTNMPPPSPGSPSMFNSGNKLIDTLKEFIKKADIKDQTNKKDISSPRGR